MQAQHAADVCDVGVVADQYREFRCGRPAAAHIARGLDCPAQCLAHLLDQCGAVPRGKIRRPFDQIELHTMKDQEPTNIGR